MAFTTTIDKTRKDIQKTLTEAVPLEAIIGAGDLAVEKLRGARAELAARIEAFDVKTAQEQAKDLPAKTQAVAGEVLTTVVSTAVAAYGDLAERGQSLVVRVRRQQATSDLSDQVDSTVAKVKAATTTATTSAKATKTSAKRTVTTAKKAAKSTRPAAKGTVTTAKKSATRTKTATKGAVTSAKKSATAAKKAATATANKVGN